jgi:dTDP-4-dehydrorhamnose 3,5-epimerase
MKLTELPIKGAFLVEIEPHHDERGFFSRTWCSEEFSRMGLSPLMVQSSISYNKKRGTIRGMHMQLPPSKESKLVRCARGSIIDTIIDLRPDSTTFLRHHQVELHATLGNAIYIPTMIAHGFQTLTDDTEVFYQMSDFFAPNLSVGWRWSDQTFNIQWPIVNEVTIGQRDADYDDFCVKAYKQLLTR